MRKFVVCCIVAMMLAGCAGRLPVKEEADPGRQAMRQAVSDLRAGLEALEDEDDDAAWAAFARAFRAFDEASRPSDEPLKDASVKLVKVVETGGFEYARRQALSLLLLYIDMQKAYADRDGRSADELLQRFDSVYRETVQVTLQEKQRRMEELNAEIASRKEELLKTSEPSLLETFPSSYTVRKGDTLPGIASRREIYNDSFMWPLIYKANRDQIKDPKVLYEGQDLKIPREMAVEEIVEARREAGAPEPEKIPKDAYTPRRKK
ncbi:MAG TPA: LysM domain-containing protein [Deltaproteobacteria bacterium]|nr:LysM domain-containing protein [Deltaproteobacteria bacterium]HOM30092.1 LysM domain-containing protein [Deltaproteobacteria bacterium]HPP79911.1 LysM domain-containing protein [Deltaproteobacteria bacterium]